MYQNAKRHELRALYADVLLKIKDRQEMTALEKEIADVIIAHPEYHSLLTALDQDFMPEQGQSNPFLHMSLHMTIREQVSLDRPNGITQIYDTLLKKHQDVHDVEHQMMEVLGEILFDAQKEKRLPDEKTYLNRVNALCYKC